MEDGQISNKVSFLDCNKGAENPACGFVESGAFESILPFEDTVDPQEGLDALFQEMLSCIIEGRPCPKAESAKISDKDGLERIENIFDGINRKPGISYFAYDPKAGLVVHESGIVGMMDIHPGNNEVSKYLKGVKQKANGYVVFSLSDKEVKEADYISIPVLTNPARKGETGLLIRYKGFGINVLTIPKVADKAHKGEIARFFLVDLIDMFICAPVKGSASNHLMERMGWEPIAQLRSHKYWREIVKARQTVLGRALAVFNAGSQLSRLWTQRIRKSFAFISQNTREIIFGKPGSVLIGGQAALEPAPAFAGPTPGPTTSSPANISLPKHVKKIIKEAMAKKGGPTMYLTKNDSCSDEIIKTERSPRVKSASTNIFNPKKEAGFKTDLTVNLFGHNLRNPVMPAAGPNCRDGAILLEAAKGGAGGLVVKTISVEPAQVPVPNIASVRKGSLINAELWSEIPYQQYLDAEYGIAKSTGLFVMASIGYSAKELAKLGPLVEKTGCVDAIEFSIHYLGMDFKPVVDSAKALRQSVSIPILAKISPGFPDIAKLVEMLEPHIDGIVAINSLGPCLDFDPVTVKPLLGSTNGYGWISGKAIFPLSLRIVHELSRQTDVPIIGVGGIYKGVDAIKMMMAGASAVQVCSAAIEAGSGVYGKIAGEMDDWLAANGYSSVRDIVGLYSRKDIPENKVYNKPKLAEKKCNQCNLCIKSCIHHAVVPNENKYPVFTEQCSGCGFCVSKCPTNAITIDFTDK